MNGEPSIRRKFQLTDLVNNNNKWWLLEWWEDGTLKTTYGRVGAAGQSTIKIGTSKYKAERLIEEKTAKGYVEIDLHIPAVVDTTGIIPTKPVEPKVQAFLEFIFAEAGQQIQSYLAVGVDALSQAQIQRGRHLLQQINNRYSALNFGYHQWPDVVGLVEQYYNTIPTKLPPFIDADEVARGFVADLNEQEDRLKQLEAALASYVVQQTGNSSLVDQLSGTELVALDKHDPAFTAIANHFTSTTTRGNRVLEIFTVNIPAERAAFEAETKGASYITNLWHGTRSHNVHHVLRNGLIVPKTASNGRRLGDGIYFADMSERAFNYTGSRNDNRRIGFLAEVKLGRMKEETGSATYTMAPHGYDSVWGTQSYSGMDEFVVYKTSQQTIRAVVVVE